MELIETVIIALQFTTILGRKRYKDLSSSEESIENILYYKDCNHKRKNNEAPALRESIGPPEPKQQECKMYCSMCCGEDCVHNHQSLTSRQKPSMMNERNLMGSVSKPMPREPDAPVQPPLRGRKKKFKQSLLPPIGGRREFGFTRENIKNLIAQDDDIKKILKDLVKVTMQKVDLVALLNSRRNPADGSAQAAADSEDAEDS